MSASGPAGGILAATVHILDPVERVPLVLQAGTKVTDPVIAEQINNPRCWQPDAPDVRRTSARKPKAAQ
ncbi:hypothetical protein GCM10010339_70990 [Streptomyces alanosinicus]|uniref:Uncharacterized protein n=1 Tax=Streptomyces alanosinicus TaxID=68171 RepID=A0A918YQ41_9ACTN|nr:hypothetical protein GCM10010339_70990 [Streptomyces alanosinicus]